MWRRKPAHRVRAEGEPIPDGDVYLFPGQRERLTEMITREYPAVPVNPPGTDSTRLVRPFVLRRRGRAS
jgi:hypothetical protein